MSRFSKNLQMKFRFFSPIFESWIWKKKKHFWKFFTRKIFWNWISSLKFIRFKDRLLENLRITLTPKIIFDKDFLWTLANSKILNEIAKKEVSHLSEKINMGDGGKVTILKFFKIFSFNILQIFFLWIYCNMNVLSYNNNGR